LQSGCLSASSKLDKVARSAEDELSGAGGAGAPLCRGTDWNADVMPV
jgi:hypothetical protein